MNEHTGDSDLKNELLEKINTDEYKALENQNENWIKWHKLYAQMFQLDTTYNEFMRLFTKLTVEIAGNYVNEHLDDSERHFPLNVATNAIFVYKENTDDFIESKVYSIAKMIKMKTTKKEVADALKNINNKNTIN